MVEQKPNTFKDKILTLIEKVQKYIDKTLKKNAWHFFKIILLFLFSYMWIQARIKFGETLGQMFVILLIFLILKVLLKIFVTGNRKFLKIWHTALDYVLSFVSISSILLFIPVFLGLEKNFVFLSGFIFMWIFVFTKKDLSINKSDFKLIAGILAFVLVNQAFLIPLMTPRVQIESEAYEYGELFLENRNDSNSLNKTTLVEKLNISMQLPLVRGVTDESTQIGLDSNFSILKQNYNSLMRVEGSGNKLIINPNSSRDISGWNFGQLKTNITIARKYSVPNYLSLGVSPFVNTSNAENAYVSIFLENPNEFELRLNPLKYLYNQKSEGTSRLFGLVNDLKDSNCVCVSTNDLNFFVEAQFDSDPFRCMERKKILNNLTIKNPYFFINGTLSPQTKENFQIVFRPEEADAC